MFQLLQFRFFYVPNGTVEWYLSSLLLAEEKTKEIQTYSMFPLVLWILVIPVAVLYFHC